MESRREFIVKLIEFLGGKTYIAGYGGVCLDGRSGLQRVTGGGRLGGEN